jgi:hypothetical protein
VLQSQKYGKRTHIYFLKIVCRLLNRNRLRERLPLEGCLASGQEGKRQRKLMIPCSCCIPSLSHPPLPPSLTPPLPPPRPQPFVQIGQYPICLVTKHYEPSVFVRIVKKAQGCRPPVCAGDQTKQMPQRRGSSPTRGEQTTRLRANAAVLQGSQVQYERTYFKRPYSCMQGSCDPRALQRFVRTDYLWPRATAPMRTRPPTTNTVFKIPHCSILMRYPLHDQQAAALTTYA